MSINQLQDLQFQLKFVTKQFAKNSTRCEKEQKQEMRKCKQAMEKGNMDGARIFAQNSIRKKNESINHLRLAARMDAVVSRLDTAIKMKMVTKGMGQMVKGMDKVLNAMNPEAISNLMDKFEKQFETMDVTSEYMENAIGQTTATSMPEDEVNTLMAQVADEHGLDIKQHLDDKIRISKTNPMALAPVEHADDETDNLEEQFARLRGK
ncbi:charged multivesicular body protein 1 [Trypanosoma rangeli]|uniref:Charged multivesicular body protein 1 n=1 Tax=Trypanosoma rangeli TaxID=5698 RepID=A0A3R7NNK8_TRYRA|nr:charged multivesicular body protein 1 [Trypanosoma rangeli]RNF09032.1 charged multivesicular body protein 1 [Trypanosoma rangeli]|eukprot:RNF09032.1 charged multivesicular body protein 1 [Trypanosoma rangeli]